jgi:hypothetical protein
MTSLACPAADMGFAIWLRCHRRFVRTSGTWPEHQGRMVAAALEASGLSVKVLPVGERPSCLRLVRGMEGTESAVAS